MRALVLLILALLLFPNLSSAQAPEPQSPIIFLPGFMGSRLYVSEENGTLDKAWEGFTAGEMRRLALDNNGESVNEVLVGSTIETFSFELGISIPTVNLYKSFLDSFTCPAGGLSQHPQPQTLTQANLENINPSNVPGRVRGRDCGKTIVSYPYDWRMDVFDIVDDGTTYTTGITANLIDLVEFYAQESETGQVQIVAHSNGGLLAKALMIRLEEQDKDHLIQRVAVVGSPQYGTPQTIGAMLHGYKQMKAGGLVLRPSISRNLSLNTMGSYNLLPSSRYFERIENPVLHFSNSTLTSAYKEKFGEITSSAALGSFLIDSKHRTKPETKSITEPEILSPKLLAQSQETKQKLDEWVPPQDLEFIEIAGTGVDTAKGFRYSTEEYQDCSFAHFFICENKERITYTPLFTQEGDGTVVMPSAVTGIGNTFYFDLEKLEDKTSTLADHLTLFESTELSNFLTKILAGQNPTSPYITTTRPEYPARERMTLSAHSPVSITAIDSQGNETSITTHQTNGEEVFLTKEEIPGSAVDIIGEGKYLILPDGDYDIELIGTDTGSFDLVFSDIKGDGSLSEQNRFVNIPTVKDGMSKTNITSENFGALSVDLENDGINDFVFTQGETESSEVRSYVKTQLQKATDRATLSGAVHIYLELLEKETDEVVRSTYVSHLERIIRYLETKTLTQEDAEKLTALVQHLR